MELQERIAMIVKENNLKQKEFAGIIGVTESYVSTLISGRNKNISLSLASLIEEKMGYNTRWILSGNGEKLKQVGEKKQLSDTHKRAIMQLEKMPEDQISAVLAFIDSLEKIKLNLTALDSNN